MLKSGLKAFITAAAESERREAGAWGTAPPRISLLSALVCSSALLLHSALLSCPVSSGAQGTVLGPGGVTILDSIALEPPGFSCRLLPTVFGLARTTRTVLPTTCAGPHATARISLLYALVCSSALLLHSALLSCPVSSGAQGTSPPQHGLSSNMDYPPERWP